MKKKPVKKPKPTHFIEIEANNYYLNARSSKPKKRYTWRIVRNGRILASSTVQLYSRRVDAHMVVAEFLQAAREGRVEIVK